MDEHDDYRQSEENAEREERRLEWDEEGEEVRRVGNGMLITFVMFIVVCIGIWQIGTWIWCLFNYCQ